jgi:hypothetical protein
MTPWCPKQLPVDEYDKYTGESRLPGGEYPGESQLPDDDYTEES